MFSHRIFFKVTLLPRGQCPAGKQQVGCFNNIHSAQVRLKKNHSQLESCGCRWNLNWWKILSYDHIWSSVTKNGCKSGIHKGPAYHEAFVGNDGNLWHHAWRHKRPISWFRERSAGQRLLDLKMQMSTVNWGERIANLLRNISYGSPIKDSTMNEIYCLW